MKQAVIPLALLLSLLAASCGVYSAQGTDIPLIDHRGMVNLNGNLSLAHVQGNASVGITDHLALATSFSFAERQKYYNQYMAGYYNPIGRGVLELYGGFGYGYGRQYYDHDPRMGVKGRYQIYFAQVDYGWNNLANNHIDLGFALKTGLLHSNLHRIGTSTHYHYPELAPANHLLLEPSVQFRVGGQHLKFSITLAYSFISSSRMNNPAHFSYDPVNLLLGLNIKL